MLAQLLASLGADTSLVEFGEVVEHEKEIFGATTPPKTDSEKKDAEQSADFNGYIIVKLYRNEVRVRAVYMVSLGGRSQWAGGLPEKGAPVVLLNAGPFYLILGYVPPPLNMLIHGRKEMKRMVDGEYEIQASVYDESVAEFWRGARAKWDIYGRLVIQTGDDDLRIIYGPLLSNEYTDNVRVVKDTITEETIIMSESYKGVYGRRVDSEGSEIHKCASSIWEVTGDELRRVSGRYIVTTGEDIRLESDGQFIEFTEDGVVISSLKRAFMSSVGNFEISAGGVMRIISMMDIVLMASGSAVIKAMKELLIATVEKIVIKSLKADITIEALTKVLVKAKTQIDVDALKVNIGVAVEPVLKGATTLAALQAHTHTGNLGYVTSPPLPGQLTDALLSKKVSAE